MLRRKGASAPNFGDFTWEFFTSATDAKSTDPTDSYDMRCRPAFVLSPAFKRQYQLPKKKGLLPPTLAPAETINFHKLAIRYSESLTKDMMFTNFRDLVRKIGEVVGSGKRVKIEFAVGVLTAKDRKTRFDFDADKLKMEAGANPVVFTMSKKAARAAEEEKKEEIGPAEALAGDAEEGASDVPQSPMHQSEPQAASITYSMSDAEYADLQKMSGDQDVGPPPAAPRTGAYEVQESAYERYINNLEADAAAENELNQYLVKLQEQKDQKELEKKSAKEKKAKDLQRYILDQMAKREALKKQEIVLRKSKTDTSFYPKADREGGILDEVSMTNRKFRGIPGVPKKGMGYRVSESELIEGLTKQMQMKEMKKTTERSMKLEEEKRYIDHISMEMDYEQHTRQVEALTKKQEMLQAWEREKFLKHMKTLRVKGDVEGLRNHKTLMAQSQSSNQMDTDRTNKSGFSAAAVGYDSRK